MNQEPNNINQAESDFAPGGARGMDEINPEILAPAISQDIHEQASTILEEVKQIPNKLYEGLDETETAALKTKLIEDLRDIHSQAAEIPAHANQELQMALQ